MKMECHNNELSLEDLLCLKVFSETFEVIGLDDFIKAITNWAEREIIAGEESDTLLILASLNLEPTPDRHDVDKYLRIYQREKNIQNPDIYYSALVWLRREISYLITDSSSNEIEKRLAFFTHYFSDYPPRAFARITNLISNFYWELYDEAVPVFNSRASEMSEHQLITYVRTRLRPFYRILSNRDWLRILVD
ncbi:hypothetical protein IB221_13835 [Pantoea sp. PNT01]|uniref:hypothetical protein n=1 Tax=Pantoea sp. PNT01 TaxID=2769271 RepID=UPI001780B2FF|nr:hypothetical protein [Pantoea sp. PNT01]MBD9553333.1 hypothetical protein [Pantoea sp. PNT01]